MKNRFFGNSIEPAAGRAFAVSLWLLLAALAAFSGGFPGPALAADQIPPAHPAIDMPPMLPVFPLDQVRRGQRGYGLSVFAGTEPERFEVEIIGVMRNVSPGVNQILARLTGKGLEKIGVANGMSGSPVFLDGRLAGAVAMSWNFSHEAIAGVTPIESMRDLSGLKGVPSPAPPAPPVPLADLRAGRIPPDLLEHELARLRPQTATGATASVQWTTAGFGEMSQGMLRRALGSVSPSGEAPADGPKDLALGSAVAAVLVDGDFRLAASGTVTDHYGDQVLAFGHPFLGAGAVRIPMATSEVVTVLSSQQASFKISNIGEIVGAFEQDRLAGIQGRIGLEAPMIPLTLRVAGVGNDKPHVYHMRLADMPFYTPILIGSSLVAGLEAASYTAGAQGLDLVARFRLAGHDDLVLRQSFDGDSAASESASYLLSVAAYLVHNPLEQVAIRQVDLEVEQAPLPRAAELVGANADHTVVRPGESVSLSLDFVPYRGDRFRHSLKLDLPEDLPAGRYSLLVGDGASVDAARLALEPADPVSFAQALDLLRSFHSRRDLMVLGVYGGPGLAVAGEILPRLPGSVRSLWGAAASGSATPLRNTIAQEVREEMSLPVDGLVRIDLEVRRRDPVQAGAGGEGEKGSGKGNAAPSTTATTVAVPSRPVKEGPL